MKRGEVYWNVYRDAMGRDRKVPMVVLSQDGYNETAQFVTGVRVVQYDSNPCKQHVHIPAEAFENTMVMADSVALCETVTSYRQTGLAGPIAKISDPKYLDAICEGVKYQCGMPSRLDYLYPVDERAAVEQMKSKAPTVEKPWYSAVMDQVRLKTKGAGE